MRLVRFITNVVSQEPCSQRELKNLYWNRDKKARHHLRDFGTMAKTLDRLISHGVVYRFRKLNKATRRMNWYYDVRMKDSALQAYMDVKQAQFDHHRNIGREKAAVRSAVWLFAATEPLASMDPSHPDFMRLYEMECKLFEAMAKFTPAQRAQYRAAIASRLRRNSLVTSAHNSLVFKGEF